MQPLSAVELRRFGLTVGGVFLALGVVSHLRGHDVAPLDCGEWLHVSREIGRAHV